MNRYKIYDYKCKNQGQKYGCISFLKRMAFQERVDVSFSLSDILDVTFIYLLISKKIFILLPVSSWTAQGPWHVPKVPYIKADHKCYNTMYKYNIVYIYIYSQRRFAFQSDRQFLSPFSTWACMRIEKSAKYKIEVKKNELSTTRRETIYFYNKST